MSEMVEKAGDYTDYGPSYLDFITPDDVFDKGPEAVKEWQARYAAALAGHEEKRSGE